MRSCWAATCTSSTYGTWDAEGMQRCADRLQSQFGWHAGRWQWAGSPAQRLLWRNVRGGNVRPEQCDAAPSSNRPGYWYRSTKRARRETTAIRARADRLFAEALAVARAAPDDERDFFAGVGVRPHEGIWPGQSGLRSATLLRWRRIGFLGTLTSLNGSRGWRGGADGGPSPAPAYCGAGLCLPESGSRRTPRRSRTLRRSSGWGARTGGRPTPNPGCRLATMARCTRDWATRRLRWPTMTGR